MERLPQASSENENTSSKYIKRATSLRWTGAMLIFSGFVSLGQLDYGPLTPVESLAVIGLGFLISGVGESWYNKITGRR